MFSLITVCLELILTHAVSSCCWNILLSTPVEYPTSDLAADRASCLDALSTSFLSSVFTGLTRDPYHVKRFPHSSGRAPPSVVSLSPSDSLHSKSFLTFLTWRSAFLT